MKAVLLYYYFDVTTGVPGRDGECRQVEVRAVNRYSAWLSVVSVATADLPPFHVVHTIEIIDR